MNNNTRLYVKYMRDQAERLAFQLLDFSRRNSLDDDEREEAESVTETAVSLLDELEELAK